jgi:hypothetical protein
MENILYYPYINIPRTDWTLRTLLYYNNVGTIVPQEYFYYPDRCYKEFMLELVRNGLVTPINPMEILDNPWEVTKPFLDLIEKNKKNLLKAKNNFRYGDARLLHQDKFSTARIHSDKFDDNVFYSLQQLGLARKDDGYWYSVETKTANNLMRFLATIVSTKTNRLPTTDSVMPVFRKYIHAIEQRKRETILENLIPFPEEIDLKRLMQFKEKHSDLLCKFRTKVELIALDPNVRENSNLFNEKMNELLQRKQELTNKMNESKFKNILFGTVCGLIGAYQGLESASTNGAIIGALPGFANAVYSALKIERAENIFDQSGLKYLALVDKRIRR